MHLDVVLLTLYNKAFENTKQAVLNKEVLDQCPNAGNHKIAHKITLQKIKQMNWLWWPTPVTPELRRWKQMDSQFQKASSKGN